MNKVEISELKYGEWYWVRYPANQDLGEVMPARCSGKWADSAEFILTMGGSARMVQGSHLAVLQHIPWPKEGA